MGISKSESGIASLLAARKDKSSWDDVIKNARTYGIGPEKVSELIYKYWEETFYKGFSIQTFTLAAVYQERLNKLKKGEKPYEAQSWILKHYPALVDIKTLDLMQQKKKAKVGSHTAATIREKLRGKREIIRAKHARIVERNGAKFKEFCKPYYKSSYLQKTIKKFYIR